MKSSQLSLHFKKNPVSSTPIHKHLAMLIGNNMSYKDFKECNKGDMICLLRKFQQSLRRHISNPNL